MATTANLNLPLIDDNTVNNVKRDMNALAQAVDAAVTEALSDVTVPDATTTQKGIVRLNDATNSTSITEAATANAVKKAYELAELSLTSGNERKAELVAALVAKGISATTDETWAQLLAKVTALIKATGNATVGQVRAGAIFSNTSGNGLVGTLTVQSTGVQTITPGTANIVKPAGIYDGAITVLGDADLLASNFPKDVNLFGIQGTLERMTTAERNAIIAAIVAKGVAATNADSNTVLAQKIGQIQTKKYIELSFGTIGPNASYTANFGFVPEIVAVFVKDSSTQLKHQSISFATLLPSNDWYSTSTADGAVRAQYPMSSSMTIYNYNSYNRYDLIVRAWG